MDREECLKLSKIALDEFLAEHPWEKYNSAIQYVILSLEKRKLRDSTERDYYPQPEW